MNAYRVADTTGSQMIVMGTSADHAREIANQIIKDAAEDFPGMVSSKIRIDTVTSI